MWLPQNLADDKLMRGSHRGFSPRSSTHWFLDFPHKHVQCATGGLSGRGDTWRTRCGYLIRASAHLRMPPTPYAMRKVLGRTRLLLAALNAARQQHAHVVPHVPEGPVDDARHDPWLNGSQLSTRQIDGSLAGEGEKGPSVSGPLRNSDCLARRRFDRSLGPISMFAQHPSSDPGTPHDRRRSRHLPRSGLLPGAEPCQGNVAWSRTAQDSGQYAPHR
ncbi:hypothetical protein GGTG_12386 [Gaeumannomyces tritici R3-111a-1]|uniref:Uncharacterized protein n=1 Tax=Gaeumannomyces tritici (strain R3-111a-1) TaxID=644352 RepID=J3PFW1_GAET3|nr:hypothetical protein GGTG_12386 [Gaeumannomyces tritici R3-111a-1]EJT70213.1 hypothetical protein GGTG_12386 [Gaeumannomyces tritici R3-111a-1]